MVFPTTVQELSVAGVIDLWVYVDAKGRVDRLRVLQSTHPHFSDKAADMLLPTEFSPPMRDGQAVATSFPVQVRFPPSEQVRTSEEPLRYSIETRKEALERARRGESQPVDPFLVFSGRTEETGTALGLRLGASDYTLREFERASAIFSFKPSIEEGPLAYDSPPVVTRFNIPVFPTDQLLRGQGRQRVTVTWFVDASGIPFNPSADHDSSYGRSIEAAVRYWNFIPATLEGEPVTTVVAYPYLFNRFRMESALRRTAQQIDRGNIQLKSPGDLDHPLRPRVIQDIIFPVEPEKAHGFAMIRVVVDPNGRVILPEIVETDNEDLAWSVMAGLAQWRFDPPLSGGQPVHVTFQQRFQN